MLDTIDTVGRKRRLARLFGSDGRTLIIGFDHTVSVGTAGGTLSSLPDLSKQCLEGGADGLQMGLNSARTLPESVLSSSTGLVLRVDRSEVGDNMHQSIPHPNNWAHPHSVIQADGDIAVVFYIHDFRDPAATARHAKMVGNISSQCHNLGLPLMVEVMTKTDSTKPIEASQNMVDAARIGFELGADLLKIDQTPDAAALNDLVSTSPVPVLLRGGAPREDIADTLRELDTCLEAGFAGAVYGRTAWNSHDPVGVVSELSRSIHGSR